MAEIVVKEENDGCTVSANLGDSLTVELPENPTTGFRWAPTELDESIIARGTDELILGSKTVVGVGGIRVFRFRVKGLGRARLQFKLMRAWETSAPSKLFEIHVNVQ